MKSPQSNNELLNALTELVKARTATVREEDEPLNTGELAAFFYGKAKDASIARKVALNDEALEEIALYARAERAAAEYKPRQEDAKIPAKAWEMIQRWEENEFAKPKPQTKAISQEALKKLAEIVAKREELKRESKAVSHQITVVVLNPEGEIRGFEKFEKSEVTQGDITLKHTERSDRFDKRELHILCRQNDAEYEIESYRIERDRVRVSKTMKRA